MTPVRRILYVHHCPDLGGASLSMLFLIERLDPLGYAAEVFFNCPPGSATEPFRARGLRLVHNPSITTYPHAQGAWLSLRSLRPWEMVTSAFRIYPSARRFRRFLEDHPCDLVHLNSLVQVPAAVGARAAGVPVVWHVREEIHPGYLGLRRALLRRCVERCANAVIVISHRNAAQLIPSEKIRVVYNFCDFTRFDRRIPGERFRQSVGLPADRPLVLMLGGVLHSKGADTLVEAAVIVRARRPDVLFLIAGPPPTGEASPSRVKRIIRRLLEGTGLVPSVERRVMRLVARHALGDTVRFVGMRSDVPEMLAASTMLVWPASVSHFSRPIIEAGAMARPVVASDFPSSRELVRPGETGLLVPPADPRALAEAIIHLLDRPDEARRMGEAAYALALERYDAHKNAGATISLYDAILGSVPMLAGRT